MDLAIGARQTFVMMTLDHPMAAPSWYRNAPIRHRARLRFPGLHGAWPSSKSNRRHRVPDLFGVGFSELTSLLDVPLVDRTREVAD